jgi:hypothetical protein
MLRLYLIAQPETSTEDSVIVAVRGLSDLNDVSGLEPGTTAYLLGTTDPGTPPGVVATVKEVGRLIPQNCKKEVIR